MNQNTVVNKSGVNKKSIGLIALSFAAFISLGMPDGLLGVAWPGIRESFHLPLDAIGIVMVFTTAGYMASSFFSGILVRQLGIGGLLSFSCAVTALSLFIFAASPFWILFIIAAFTGGLGAGAIDAGINNYVAEYHTERMMQWLHASFGVGITLGPVIMTAGIALTSGWRPGYFLVAGFQGLLAAVFLITKDMWKGVHTEEEHQESHDNEASLFESLMNSRVLMSMLMFFFYVGVEFGLGIWTYTFLTESRNIDLQIAGMITGSYWGMFTVGRILSGWYSHKVKMNKIIFFGIISAAFGLVLVVLDINAWVTVTGIAVTGFAVAPIFPGMVSDTGYRVSKRHQTNTIGMQITASGFGGAVLPAAAGVLAKRYGLEIIPYFLLFCAVVLMIFFILTRIHAAEKGSLD